jgi:hypothetical protein
MIRLHNKIDPKVLAASCINRQRGLLRLDPLLFPVVDYTGNLW